MIIFMIVRLVGMRWAVRLSVARRGNWRAWGDVSGEFERGLTAQASESVLAPRIYSESRRGRDYVRVTVAMTVISADVAQALSTAWWAFRKAADSGWDLNSATAEVRPEGALARRPLDSASPLIHHEGTHLTGFQLAAGVWAG